MRLSSQQMARMSRLLDEVLPLDAAGRRAWLQNLTPDCQDLLPALRKALLNEAPSPSVPGLLDTLPKFEASETMHAGTAAGLQPGARIGPYELIRPLGTGGMAEVWLARRADGAYRREVALKLPLVCRLRKHLKQSFARERDILAGLEHPKIARLYDAGVDSQGLPYLAMEYVPGQPLTRWCDEHCLGIPERLRLFLQVLEAVQYAHEKQVIHRDLKPSNILVTSGQVRLLDFGVAKLLAAEQTDGPQLTAVYGRALTPAYASPEMRRGEAVDARTDLYSLGVLLCELLSGVRPDEERTRGSTGPTEVTDRAFMRAAANASAVRATTQAGLEEALRGDLDAIVSKALAKEPPARYPTAIAFAEDVERYLWNRPVHARTVTLRYRARKFLLRNRVLAGAVAIALAGVLLALGGITWRGDHGDRAAPPASTNDIRRQGAVVLPPVVPAFTPPAHSVAVLPFTNLSGDPAQEYFSDGISEELINALVHINELQVTARTSSFSFKGQNVDIGTIARKLNVSAILEGSIRRSGTTVRITAQLINTVNGYHIWSEDYDRSLKNVLQLQSDIATTVAQQLQAKLVGDEAGKIEAGGTSNPEAHDAYLHGVNLLALADTRAEVESALRSFDQAIALDPNYALAYAQRAHALAFVSSWYSSVLDEKRELLVQARESVERALKIAPHVAEAHAILGIYVKYNELDFEGATRELDQALAGAPGNAWVLKIYGAFHAQIGHYEKGLAQMRRAIQLDPKNYEFNWDLATALWQARRFSDALAAIQRAEALKPGGTTAETTWTIYLGLGRLEEARRLCETPSTPMQPDVRRSCLAVVLHKLGRTQDAEHELEELQAHDGDANAFGYAEIYAQWGDHKNALDWLGRLERLRLPDLGLLRVDWMLDPIRNEPQFRALEKRLNFPP